METSKALLEKRAGLIAQLKELGEEAKGREMTAEEQSKWDKLFDDTEALRRRAENVQKLAELEAEAAAEPEQVIEAKAITTEETEAEYRKAFMKYIRAKAGIGRLTENDINILEARAQSTTSTAGGYTIPTTMGSAIQTALLNYGGMYANSRIIKTAGGESMTWPTVDDTANVAYQLSEAGDATSAATDVTFGQFTMSAFNWTSGLVKINKQLMMDSAFDLESYLFELFGIRMARGLNAAFTTGAGTTTISGVVTGATDSAISSVGATAITRDNLVDLKFDVDLAYHLNGKYMFNQSTLSSILKLAFGTADDRPLYLAGNPQLGIPDLIEGKPFIVNPNVASIGASAKSVLFGDFNNYWIREVGTPAMVVLNERFAETLQIGIMIWQRFDGKVMDAGTNPIKYMVHAAS